MPAAAGVVDEKGSEYILAHTGPRELDGHPLGGCGSGFGLVPVMLPFRKGPGQHIIRCLKIKSVRTNERSFLPKKKYPQAQSKKDLTPDTAVDMGGAAHARTSNTWKTDNNALGCHGEGGVPFYQLGPLSLVPYFANVWIFSSFENLSFWLVFGLSCQQVWRTTIYTPQPSDQ